ncbi:glutaredoxin family protein [Brachybacterium sp. AOP25-B2-12]|uniref:glutaredoxin family protein n=1 Tax=Brachybacterium sp. AOP25-B2-12 TaxID=3457710 RepID=UPI0040340194
MDNTLTIYGKPGCPGCTWLVKRCQRKGVPYHYVDVTQDAAAFAHIKNLGYLSAPVGEIGDDHWYGARFDKIDQLAARMAKAS